METLSRASSGRWSERRVDICAASLPAPQLIAGPGSSCGVSCLEPAVLKRHPLFSTRRSGGQVGIKKRGANHALTKALTFPPLVVASSSERLEERQALRGSPSAFIVLRRSRPPPPSQSQHARRSLDGNHMLPVRGRKRRIQRRFGAAAEAPRGAATLRCVSVFVEEVQKQPWVWGRGYRSRRDVHFLSECSLPVWTLDWHQNISGSVLASSREYLTCAKASGGRGWLVGGGARREELSWLR